MKAHYSCFRPEEDRSCESRPATPQDIKHMITQLFDKERPTSYMIAGNEVSLERTDENGTLHCVRMTDFDP